LNAGTSYIHRIEPEQIKNAQAKGFQATADFSEIRGADAILICLPTPLTDHPGALGGTQRTEQNNQEFQDSCAGIGVQKDVDDLPESPSLSIIEILRRAGAEVSHNDPYFPTVGHGRKYDLNMTSEPLENVADYGCVLIVTDRSSHDYARIVREVQLIVDSRNTTRGLPSEKIVRC
jgi:UDP-N-acetyl-D-mannosaminuronate dehydrogenase